MTKKEKNKARYPLFQCVTELFFGISIKEVAGILVAPF